MWSCWFSSWTNITYSLTLFYSNTFLDAISKITGEKIPLIDLEGGYNPDVKTRRDATKAAKARNKPPLSPDSSVNSGPALTERRPNEQAAETQYTDEPVLGMGDHVPAFMTRGPKGSF